MTVRVLPSSLLTLTLTGTTGTVPRPLVSLHYCRSTTAENPRTRVRRLGEKKYCQALAWVRSVRGYVAEPSFSDTPLERRGAHWAGVERRAAQGKGRVVVGYQHLRVIDSRGPVEASFIDGPFFMWVPPGLFFVLSSPSLLTSCLTNWLGLT
jgi:hypothetical protein